MNNSSTPPVSASMPVPVSDCTSDLLFFLECIQKECVKFAGDPREVLAHAARELTKQTYSVIPDGWSREKADEEEEVDEEEDDVETDEEEEEADDEEETKKILNHMRSGIYSVANECYDNIVADSTKVNNDWEWAVALLSSHDLVDSEEDGRGYKYLYAKFVDGFYTHSLPRFEKSDYKRLLDWVMTLKRLNEVGAVDVENNSKYAVRFFEQEDSEGDLCWTCDSRFFQGEPLYISDEDLEELGFVVHENARGRCFNVR